ncbi:hypothetical protein [Streptomyces sp. NPDC018000]|uniref:hypothetical protein n=1 Tax=Streptomyces sp. NPDC018000 TaxID=3365028 RepID=UPI00379594D1
MTNPRPTHPGVHPILPRPIRCAVPEAGFQAPATRRLQYRELIGALAYEVDDQVVREYRQLLQARRQPV